MNLFKSISKIQSGLLKFFLIIILLVSIFSVVIFGGQYLKSVYDSWEKNSKIADIQKGFYEKVSTGEISAIDEGLISFMGFSSEELSSMTIQEKKIAAVQQAVNLAVFELKLDIKVNLDSSFKCAKVQSFTYDDVFSRFVVNTKWDMFYNALSVFSSNAYQYTYFSNVYVKGSQFPLQYYEDDKTTVRYDDKLGSLVSEVIFKDKVQIVLPDRDKNQLADNIELDYIITITDIYKNTEKLESQLITIPLRIENGNIELLGGATC